MLFVRIRSLTYKVENSDWCGVESHRGNITCSSYFWIGLNVQPIILYYDEAIISLFIYKKFHCK